MTGIKIATTAMMASGLGTGIAAIIEPKDLDGIGVTALLAFICLASLGLLALFMRTQVGAMNKLTEKISENTTQTSVSNVAMQALCAKMESNPCLLRDETLRAKVIAATVVEDAKLVAAEVVKEAVVTAHQVINDARRGR